MSPYLLIVIQSIALPFALSGLLLWPAVHKDEYRVLGNVLVWLIAYAWIIRWPELPPGEAVDWLWLLLAASVAASHARRGLARWYVRSAVFLISIVAIAWPVLYYQLTTTLVSELVIIVISGGVLFSRMEHRQTAAPALTVTIQATGLAIASALSGSLLVGQLSAALAAVTGAFAIAEILDRLHKTAFSTQQGLIFVPLYLALLAIARLYAELPPAPTALLLAGPVLAALAPRRHDWATNLLLNAGAIGLVVLSGDSTGYY